MNARRLMALIAALTVTMALPVRADGAAKLKLRAAPAKPRATSLVTFSGRAGKRAGVRVAVQRRVGKRWKPIARGRTARKGRFALTWMTPSKRGQAVVRVLARHQASAPKRLRIRRAAKGSRGIKVSPKTRVISPAAVRSVPAAGKPGEVTYAGGNDVQKGAIVVVGKGDDTPTGFLGRVTDVEQKDGRTVAETVPATLIQAVPQGSTHLVAAKVATRSTRAESKVTCEGSAGFSIEPDVSFSAGLDFAGSWSSNLFDGPESASVTASASVNASVEAIAQAAGSCSLGQRTLLSAKGPTVTGSIGPIPIVLTSNLSVYLDASAGVQGQITAGAHAGFDASAGVAWTKADGFTTNQSFSPDFGFDPPTVSASANIGAYLTPTVDVLLYGIAGPRVALKTGLEFNADTTQDPWWTLDVPVDLTGSIAVPALDLESPQLHIYQHAFNLADAGGPFGAPPPPPPAPVHNAAQPLTSLTVGYADSCAVRSGGTVACWGANDKGQLGTGNTTPSAVPKTVSGITDAAAVAAGHDHACALRTGGAIVCWGSDDAGQLGDGTKTAYRSAPVAVKNITNAVSIAAGAEHTCAVLGTGRVDCWGANGDHQLGDGDAYEQHQPIEVSGIRDATSVSSGEFHTCALRKTGEVACWGRNADGELGNGTKNPALVPVSPSGLGDAIVVDVGLAHSCAVHTDNSVVCWGYNGSGELADGSRQEHLSPGGTFNVPGAVALGLGDEFSCAVAVSGSVTCWGQNTWGQLGNGSSGNGDVNADNPPSAVSGLSDAVGVTAGTSHACALRKTGDVACWGYGQDGELGNGQKSNSAVPVAVSFS